MSLTQFKTQYVALYAVLFQNIHATYIECCVCPACVGGARSQTVSFSLTLSQIGSIEVVPRLISFTPEHVHLLPGRSPGNGFAFSSLYTDFTFLLRHFPVIRF